MEMLAVLAELRDDVTGEHSFRVGRMSGMLAGTIGFEKEQVALVELAARLHDIGKLAVPDVILLKRAKLLKEEMEVMRRHANEGCQILLDVLSDVQLDMAKSGRDSESFRMAAEIALHHHEWWDGTGYPRGVHGDKIPATARITALADVFDALTHERPYKKAWPIEAAIAEILSLSGRQFEPTLCMRFLDLVRELHAEHGDQLDAFLAADARSSPLVDANRTAVRVVERVLQEHRASAIVSAPRS
jgi:HD-GYP domain-containing protein (c-di-GMP phosphodiesterase class II)